MPEWKQEFENTINEMRRKKLQSNLDSDAAIRYCTLCLETEIQLEKDHSSSEQSGSENDKFMRNLHEGIIFSDKNAPNDKNMKDTKPSEQDIKPIRREKLFECTVALANTASQVLFSYLLFLFATH